SSSSGAMLRFLTGVVNRRSRLSGTSLCNLNQGSIRVRRAVSRWEAPAASGTDKERSAMKQLVIVLAVVASASIHAQSGTFGRGQQVRVKSIDPTRPPATAMTLTIVGVPNDRLSVSGGALYVNDVRVDRFSPRSEEHTSELQSRFD